MKLTHTYPPEPASVPAARRFVAASLARLEPDVLESVLVMVSELAANSVRHAGSEFRVQLDGSDSTVRVSVTDWGAGAPAMRSPAPSEPSGRGLRIVDALADRWGVDRHPDGKTVWFSVGLQRPFART